MSKTSLLTALLLCISLAGLSQTIIWQDDFASLPNGATSGNGWSANSFTNCDGTGFWGVSGGAFEVTDMEGAPCGCGGNLGGNQNTWITSAININNFACVRFSLRIDAIGTFECNFPNAPNNVCDPQGHDQAVVEYSVNGGAFILAAYICGSSGAGPIAVEGLQGNNLRIRIRIGNQSVSETYLIRNIIIEGTPVAAPLTITGPTTVCDGGTPITLTANPAGFASYVWSNGETGQSIQTNQPGTYTVTATSSSGCQLVSPPRTVNAAPRPNVNITGPNSICSSGSTTITLTATGGLASYQWSTGATTQAITVSAGGTYTVTATTAAGCSNEASRDVTLIPQPEINNPGTLTGCASVTLPEITGSNLTGDEGYFSGPNRSGTRFSPSDVITSNRTLFIFAGVPGCSNQEQFQVQITPRPNVFTINNVTACESYTLPAVPATGVSAGMIRAYFTGPDGTGTRLDAGAVITTSQTLYAYAGNSDCFDQKEFRVTIVPRVRVNDLPDQSVCDRFVLPVITGTGLTGNQGYFTQTNGGGTRFSPGDTITTTRTLFIFDRNAGCQSEESFTITVTGGPNINDIPDQVVCNSFTLPAITGSNLTANRGYFTQPNGGGTRLNPGAVITTSQTLYIFDADGACRDEESFTISIAATPSIAPIPDDTACGFYVLPAITGTGLSGGQAYYTQANGSGTRFAVGDTIRNSVALFAYDGAVGCSDEKVVNITILSPPVLDTVANQTACGRYTLPIISGINLSRNEAYFTQPNGGGTRLEIGDVVTNSGTLYVFDDNGSCRAERSFNVTILPPPVLDTIPTQVGCGFYILPAIRGSNLSHNGAYFTQPNGGGTRLSVGDTIRNNTTLFAFDSNGTCTAERSFAVAINVPPTVNTRLRNAACAGSANGSLELVVVGAAPFTFNWNVDAFDGQQNVTGLSAGNYSITVTDNRGCATIVQATINQPDPLELVCAQSRAVSARGSSDGQARLIVGGGTPGYTIRWRGASANGTLTSAVPDTILLNNLPAGSYEVTLTDANNCSTTCNFSINIEGCDVTLTLTATDASCPNVADGSIQTVVTGGTPPLRFDWNIDTLDSRQNLTGLLPGTYTLILTDSANCIVTETAQVGARSVAPSATLSSGGAICESDCFTFDVNFTGMPPFNLAVTVNANGQSVVRNIGSNSTTATLQICPRDFGIINDTIGVQLRSVRDANCEAPLSQQQTLTVNPIRRDTIADTLCANASLTVNNVVYNQSNPRGVETIRGGAANGCDSVVVINLNFLPPVVFNLEPTLCRDDSIVVNGTVYNRTNPRGTEVLAGASANGCDSTININLSFFPPVVLNLDTTICEDASIVVNGVTYNRTNPAGIEIIRSGATNGCDSTINVRLNFFPSAVFSLSQPLCEGDSIVINSVVYDQNRPTGTEILRNAGVNGCDSTVIINLSILTTPVFNLLQTLCDGDSIVVNGRTYNQANPLGTERLTRAAFNGCDSIVNINLGFFPPAMFDLNQTLCKGEAILVNGRIYDEATPTGTEVLAGLAATGCDSTVNIRLTYISPTRVTISDTLCSGESLVVNGTTYDRANTSGLETIVGGAANGCDSIIQVNLNFFTPAVFDLIQTLCDDESLIINGSTYDRTNPTGTEILPDASINGCDSIINVNLNFFPPAVFSLDRTLCDGEALTINGSIYDETNPTGVEVLSNASVNGCDSIVNINLRFFPPAVFNLNRTLCQGDSLVVNGRTYNQGNPFGTEVLRAASATGCDSIVNIQLNYILPASRVIDTLLCFGESLRVNNNVYNATRATGTEIIRGGAANGCDSIIQVNLRFAPEIVGSIAGDATICAGTSTTLTFNLSGGQSFDVRYTDGVNPPVQLRNIIDGHTVQVSPSRTTTYALDLIAVNGSSCPARIGGSALVRVSNLRATPVAVSNFGGFNVSCAGSMDGIAAAGAADGIAPFSFRWSTGATTPQLINLGAGTYSVTITDAANCEATGSITLVEPQPLSVTTTTRDPLCSNRRDGAIVLQNITGGAAPYEVSLNGASYRSVNRFPYEIGNLAAGSYNFFVRDANDCEIRLNASVVAITDPKVDLGPDVTIRLGDSTLLKAIANFTPTKIEWAPAKAISSRDGLRAVVKPQESTVYQITVADSSGCAATDQVWVFVNRARRVFIPNAFSPDGDGNNDVFYIFGGSDVVRIKSFAVFDRWGNLMYQRGEFLPNDPQYGWDGKFNGRFVSAGVYVYYAELEFIDGLTEALKGEVTVVR